MRRNGWMIVSNKPENCFPEITTYVMQILIVYCWRLESKTCLIHNQTLRSTYCVNCIPRSVYSKESSSVVRKRKFDACVYVYTQPQHVWLDVLSHAFQTQLHLIIESLNSAIMLSIEVYIILFIYEISYFIINIVSNLTPLFIAFGFIFFFEKPLVSFFRIFLQIYFEFFQEEFL